MNGFNHYSNYFTAMELIDTAWWTATAYDARLKLTRIRAYLSEEAAQSLPQWPWRGAAVESPVLRVSDRGVRADAISRF